MTTGIVVASESQGTEAHCGRPVASTRYRQTLVDYHQEYEECTAVLIRRRSGSHRVVDEVVGPKVEAVHTAVAQRLQGTEMGQDPVDSMGEPDVG
jgi:hypothetical protein